MFSVTNIVEGILPTLTKIQKITLKHPISVGEDKAWATLIA